MKQACWILALTLIVTSGMALAQRLGGPGMVAQVPFEFVVANKIVPAGEWSVSSENMSSTILTIRNSEAKVGLLSQSMMDDTKHAAASYALVFKRYGDQYFLSAIRLEGSKITYRLPESRAEAEMRAKNVPVTERILLAAVK